MLNIKLKCGKRRIVNFDANNVGKGENEWLAAAGKKYREKL